MNIDDGSNPIKDALTTHLVVHAFKLMSVNDQEGLDELGLNEQTVEKLHKMKNMDIGLVVEAFNRGLSVMTYLDSAVIENILTNNIQQSQNNILLTRFVRAGASFDLIRHFFKTYTNRKHTAMRQEQAVNYTINDKEKASVNIDEADEFFASFYGNKEMQADDFLTFAENNNYTMGSVWLQMKIYIENGIT